MVKGEITLGQNITAVGVIVRLLDWFAFEYVEYSRAIWRLKR